MDVWSWICELPNSDEWTHSESESHLTFTLASSGPSPNHPTQSIQLRADSSHTSEPEASIRFSVRLEGFNRTPSDDEDQKPRPIIWASDACPLSSENPFLPLVLQLLREIVSRSPMAQDSSTCPRSQLQLLQRGQVSWILDSHSPESFSRFFNLVLLTRLFWVCACDAPSDVGSFFFHSLLAPNIATFACHHAPVLRNFFVAVGADVELCFMRTTGY